MTQVKVNLKDLKALLDYCEAFEFKHYADSLDERPKNWDDKTWEKFLNYKHIPNKAFEEAARVGNNHVYCNIIRLCDQVEKGKAKHG